VGDLNLFGCVVVVQVNFSAADLKQQPFFLVFFSVDNPGFDLSANPVLH